MTISKGVGKPPFMDYTPQMHCEYCGRFLRINKKMRVASCDICKASWLVLAGTADIERRKWCEQREKNDQKQ